ncbi:MAG: beta-galactosidase trimerization domain-containing protein [Bryobacterales bacterium]|nr:beta-galactosidase trimerization domain-containing protein [Bryobacterales bacterium]
MRRRDFLVAAGTYAAHSANAQPKAGSNGTTPAKDEFMHGLYDRLHDSPTQRKFRALAPMPWGVVFLPWKGITEEEMRRHFRLMKSLGFHNLKQAMPTPEWPHERVLEIALEEDVIPFWYGEAGWEEITPALLRKLGLPETLTIREARLNPKMRAYQKEVLRKQIPVMVRGEGRPRRNAPTPPGAFRHTPDPYLRPDDVPHFKHWLRATYKSPGEIADAWNQYEVGFGENPVKTWEDVDRLVETMARLADNLGGYGREYGRVRDVLRYKADYHTRELEERFTQFHAEYPDIPTRTGGEMGLFLPFAWRATKMEDLAETQKNVGSFYPSIHMAWHYGEVNYEVARTVYMQAAFARDLFKGGWAATWESTGGPQQLTGGKGWDYPEQSTTAGFTINDGVMAQLQLSYLAAGFRGCGIWTWNYRAAGFEAGDYALLNRQLRPSARAIRVGKIAQAADQYREELWAAHKEPLVGVLANWDSDAIWAAIAVRQRDHFKHYPMQARVGVCRALINGNIPFEFVTVDDLRAGLAPRYKTIYLAAQIGLSEEVLRHLLVFAKQGGRVVLDAPGGNYDDRGKVLRTEKGSTFEQIFGVEVADIQYSNNVPRMLGARKLSGFVMELTPTTASVGERFQTREPAVTVNRCGSGEGVVLAWDATFALFKPGNDAAEEPVRRYALGARKPGYACAGAVVYRLAAPEADHYFFINDNPARQVTLETPAYRYRGLSDPVTGERLKPGAPVALEAYGARWLRFEKADS